MVETTLLGSVRVYRTRFGKSSSILDMGFRNDAPAPRCILCHDPSFIWALAYHIQLITFLQGQLVHALLTPLHHTQRTNETDQKSLNG
jgi:hypothetical protein